MIIGTESRIHSVTSFVEGLQQAARGVLLFKGQVVGLVPPSTGDPIPLSTGWLITDSLLVVPSHLIQFASLRYVCQPDGDEPEIELGIVDPPGPISQPQYGVAVLRLARPLPGQALRLAAASAQTNESILILHYPDGRPTLHLSAGRFLAVSTDTLRYDADTLAGSGGAPVFSSRNWEIVGMHMGSREVEKQNEGIPLGRLLDNLRSSAAWPEIAAFHRLADMAEAHRALTEAAAEAAVAPPSAPVQSTQLQAAVRWHFRPDEFGDPAVLKGLVADPTAKRWTLKTHERQRILDAAPSLAALRAARAAGGGSKEPGQQVIDRILQGPPYALSQIDEGALSYWLQAVRWYGKVIPELPSTASVNQELARRRVRGQLREITGGAIRGREKELRDLAKWFHTVPVGPMVITGIGGIGKSTLVAQFALQQPAETVLLWLDFDRAGLAPDDAVSVLGTISEQMSVQVAGYARARINEQEWEVQATAIGVALELASARLPALLVLDGFEVAQHVARHSEIWRVLDKILERAPQLHVIVSGRAPVKGLALRGPAVEPINLIGLTPPEARQWLREKGIDDPAINQRVAEVSKGVPLLLQLTLYLFENGEPMPGLLARLPEVFIEGFLYQRILNRVMDEELKGLANDALVLRTLTPGLIDQVLPDRIPPGLDSREAFKRLSQEMGLVDAEGHALPALAINVGEAGRLQLRPDVRSATLRLLETDDAGRVREIDRRAVAWYEGQNLAEAANAAELVYHRLRLRDVAGAQEAWRAECAVFLEHAADDLPEDAREARAWLQEKVSGASGQLATWEARTVLLVQDRLRRGIERGVAQVLSERPGRSAQSPLVFYDAWVRWKNRDVRAAREILEKAASAEGPIQRDRTLLRAAIAADEGRREEADQLLEEIQAEELWRDRADGGLDALGVLAARVRLTVDLDAELELQMPRWRTGDGFPGADAARRRLINNYLIPADLLLGEFFNSDQAGRTESLAGIPVPADAGDFNAFQKRLDDYRRREMHLAGSDTFISLHRSRQEAFMYLSPSSQNASEEVRRASELALLSWQRWKLASTTPFLRQADALFPYLTRDSFSLAIVATLMPFRGIPLFLPSGLRIDNLLAGSAETFFSVPTLPPGARFIALVRKWLPAFINSPSSGETQFPVSADAVRDFFDQLEQSGGREQPWVETGFRILDLNLHPSIQASLLLYALSPEPLDLLCQRAALPVLPDPPT